MLINAVEQITKISDNAEINSSNYFEGINYINTLYNFISKLKLISEKYNTIEFAPTFKGRFTCEKFNIPSTEDENLMKVLVIKNAVFLEEIEVKKNIDEILGPICRNITYDKDMIKFVLI